MCNKKDDQSTSAPGKRPQTILAKAVCARSKTKSLPNIHESYDCAASKSRGEPKENLTVAHKRGVAHTHPAPQSLLPRAAPHKSAERKHIHIATATPKASQKQKEETRLRRRQPRRMPYGGKAEWKSRTWVACPKTRRKIKEKARSEWDMENFKTTLR